MLTEQQIELHKTHIGGSTAPIAIGQSPRMTARELYHIMRGEMDFTPPPVEPTLLWLGHQVEPIVHNWVTEQTGWRLRKSHRTRRRKCYPWAVAHIDREIVGEPRIGEFKMRGTREGWGEEGTADIPTPILIQCLHYLAVLPKIEAVEVFVFFRISGDFGHWTVTRDEEYIAQLMTAEQIFMDHVKRGEPPAWDYNHPTTLELMKQVYPGTNGCAIDLPEDAGRWWDAMEEARERRRTADEDVRIARTRILGYLELNSIGRLVEGDSISQKRDATGKLHLKRRRHLEFQ